MTVAVWRGIRVAAFRHWKSNDGPSITGLTLEPEIHRRRHEEIGTPEQGESGYSRTCGPGRKNARDRLRWQELHRRQSHLCGARPVATGGGYLGLSNRR